MYREVLTPHEFVTSNLLSWILHIKNYLWRGTIEYLPLQFLFFLMANINIFTYNEKIAVQIKETAKRYKKTDVH
jgi:hypothetical protein